MKKIYWILISGVLIIIAIILFKNLSGSKAILVTTEKAEKRNIKYSKEA